MVNQDPSCCWQRLNLHQRFNLLRLVQFECIFRRQTNMTETLKFVIWNRVENIQWAKEKMVVTSIFSFSHNFFSKSLKVIMVGNELTHYQMTIFRHFRIERLCRRPFQIWRKWQKVIQTGRKHCGKGRNCSLRAISPFPTVFSKGLFPRVKRCHCVGMG